LLDSDSQPRRTADYFSATANEGIPIETDRGQPSRDRQLTVFPGHVPRSDKLGNASARTIGSTQGAALKIVRVLRQELSGLHSRLLVAHLILAPLPIHVGGRMRAWVLRWIGFKIDRGTILAGMPTITGDGNIYRKLVIGPCCWINIGCLFDLGAEIRIGSHVSIGHDVLVLTVTHEIGPSWHRAHRQIAKRVNIGSGVWVGSRSTILPGVTIGSGAIVAAGSVVHHDVPPNTMVAGVPARAIKELL